MNKRPCKRCDTEIIVIKGPDGKYMAFDVEPNTVWYLDKKKGEARSFPAHTPHRATCPNAGEAAHG